MKLNIKNRSSQKGFSLIELMIVIAIIGILIGVGVPAWRLMLRRGNETAAIQTLTTIKQLQADYALGHRGQYGTFDEMIKEGALDKRFEGDKPVVSGYIFTMKVTPKSSGQQATFAVNADPQQSEGIAASGKRHFYFDPSIGTIRENPDQPATVTDEPIGQ